MTPDLYDIIASIGFGHAYEKHVLGYKVGHDHFGVNEFTDSQRRFGDNLPVETEDQFSQVILDVVNDPSTRAFYDVDKNIVTMANISKNLIVNFNHSPVHGDAGSAYRVFDPDGDRINQKYQRALSEAQSTDGLVLEARSPEEAKAYVERYANTKDFTKVSYRSARTHSAFDKMVDNRGAGQQLKHQDEAAFTGALRNQRLNALDGRIESERLELKTRAEADLEAQRLMTGQKQDAAHMSNEIINTIKKGGVVFFEPTKSNDQPSAVLIEGDDDVLYEIVMAVDGRSAIISRTDGEERRIARLDTKSRLNHLKNNVTQSEKGLLNEPGWGKEADGRPLSWVRKAGLTLVTVGMMAGGATNAQEIVHDARLAQAQESVHEIVLSAEDLGTLRGRLDFSTTFIQPDDLGDGIYLPTAEELLNAAERREQSRHSTLDI